MHYKHWTKYYVEYINIYYVYACNACIKQNMMPVSNSHLHSERHGRHDEVIIRKYFLIL